MDQAQHFQNLFFFPQIKKKKKKKPSEIKKSTPPHPHNPVPFLIIKALSGVYFIHTLLNKHIHTRTHTLLLFTNRQQSRDRRTSTFYWILYTDWIAHLASIPYLNRDISSENIQKDITLQACVKAQFIVRHKYPCVWWPYSAILPYQYIRRWKKRVMGLLFFIIFFLF